MDDSTLDKPYAGQSALVCQHWSGKRRAAVWGINRVSLVRTGGDRPYPVAYRLYDRAGDGKAKNDHARARSGRAKQRG